MSSHVMWVYSEHEATASGPDDFAFCPVICPAGVMPIVNPGDAIAFCVDPDLYNGHSSIVFFADANLFVVDGVLNGRNTPLHATRDGTTYHVAPSAELGAYMLYFKEACTDDTCTPTPSDGTINVGTTRPTASTPQ